MGGRKRGIYLRLVTSVIGQKGLVKCHCESDQLDHRALRDGGRKVGKGRRTKAQDKIGKHTHTNTNTHTHQTHTILTHTHTHAHTHSHSPGLQVAPVVDLLVPRG